MEYIISFTVLLVETYCALQLFDSLMIKKLPLVKHYLIGLVSAILIFAVINSFELQPLIKTIVIIVDLLIVAILLYSGRFITKIVLTLSFYTILALSNYLILFIFMRFLGIDTNTVVMNEVYWVFATILTEALSFTITLLVKRLFAYKRIGQFVPAWNWILSATYPLITIVTLFVFMDTASKAETLPKGLILCAIGLLVSNIFIVFLIEMLDDFYKTRADRIIMQGQVDQGLQYIKSLSENYDAQRRITHDFKNHIVAINSLIKQDDNASAQKYIQSIITTIETNTLITNTHNPLVDTLLTQKYNDAKSRDVILEFQLGDLNSVPIENEDLVVLLSNTIENAIEACCKCTDRRIVRIRFFPDNCGYVYSVINGVSQRVKIDNNNIKTTKANSFLHGYGLRNVGSVLKKYSSDYAITCDDKWFQFTAIISIP